MIEIMAKSKETLPLRKEEDGIVSLLSSSTTATAVDANMNEKCSITVDQTEETVQNTSLIDHQKQIRLISTYIIITVIGLVCIGLIIAFVLVPVIFAHWVYIQRLAMFTNIGLPSNHEDFATLDKYPNLLFRNFFINFTDSNKEQIYLGVWHLPCYKLYPNESEPNNARFDFMQSLKNDTADVVIYFHGSGECRKDPLMMYNVLLNFFHVIAFDYRDFGDSTPAVLSEKDVAEDAVHVVDWVKRVTSRRIYIWGHSLGTPVSTLTINYLPNFQPHGLILESPMTNMNEEIGLHPYGKIFAWLPWFKQTIQDPLKRNGFLFETDKYILSIECPILILHAEDDSIIPYTLGKKLAEIAADQRPKDVGNVTYVQFAAKNKYDHFRIWKSKRLFNIIPNFIEICDEYYNKTHKIPKATSTTTLPKFSEIQLPQPIKPTEINTEDSE